jgi:predicted phage terminase large subunit-like protein
MNVANESQKDKVYLTNDGKEDTNLRNREWHKEQEQKNILNKEVMEGFVGSCLVPYFDNPAPFKEFHRDLWEICTDRKEQFVAVCAPRRHSKSTTVTISYTLAACLFRQSKFVIIVSDTISQSVLFLGQIKQILEDSKQIQSLFGLIVDDKGLVYEKCTEDDIIIRFNDGRKFRIMAKGAEQKLRGLLFEGQRPDLIICDDILNEELVANKDRRDKLRRWFYGSLVPCRSRDGRLILIGTPMNLDDILESLMPSERAKNTIVEDLKVWSTKKTGMWRTIKYRAHNADFSKILWPEMHSPQSLRELRTELTDQGIPEVYSCEMLCNPVDDSIRYFRKTDFLAMTEEDKKQDLTYYITADLAISEKDRADYTAIVVGGMDYKGQLHIVHVIRERIAGDEIVKTLIALQRTYQPIAVGIEDTQISKAIGPYLNRAMMEAGVYLNIKMLKPHRQDKIQRARSIQARMRAQGVKFDKDADWWDMFFDECLSFPRAKHDDCVDALAYQGILIDYMSEGLTTEELDEEEYEEAYERAGFNDVGREATTGY